MTRKQQREEFLERTKLVGEDGARAFIKLVLIKDMDWYFASVKRCAFFSHTIRIAAFVASMATTVTAALMHSNSRDPGATQVDSTLLVVFGVVTSLCAVLLTPSNQLWQLRSEGKRMSRAVYEEALVGLRLCTNDDEWDELHDWMREKERDITDRQANSFFSILSTAFKPGPPTSEQHGSNKRPRGAKSENETQKD